MNQQTDLHDMFAHAAKGLGSMEVMGDPRAVKAIQAARDLLNLPAHYDRKLARAAQWQVHNALAEAKATLAAIKAASDAIDAALNATKQEKQ